MENLSLAEIQPIVQTILVTIPVFWGVYEFRQFRSQLMDIYKKADEINDKLDDIGNNKLDKYPLLKDVKTLLDKINKVFNIQD
jgi:hypothetical protein